ncbi:unnamed protein product [Caenorhabditis bovis]|uniref:Phospholysine phosphohistidine inorganic pyrophosphate phosphatase n=1 Tax=Caenorhabditis bovis TaxID=2654633 RepID=A0A8S1EAB6_9PELO|nr:unnamed protein product [Caenorhabditis bovis]
MSAKRNVKGFLLDITGVLYNSRMGTDGVAIPRSAEAVQMLYDNSKVKFLSNSKGYSNANVAKRLQRLGINVREEDVITPAPIVAEYCRRNNLNPHLFIRNDVAHYFAGLEETETPNCVVMGEVEDGFSFDRINKAFRVLLNMEKPFLITMGNGKYFQRIDGPCIDIGAFAAALKFATNCEVMNIGKPSKFYFQEGIRALGLDPSEIAMIGDDIASDIGGAQDCGMIGIQVRTGKWRPEFENHPVKPDLIVDCLYDAVKQILENNHTL